MFDNLKKPKNIGIIAIVLGFLVPIGINLAYLQGLSTPLIITMWDAADMLQYFGTLLGAAATIFAVTWTIITTKKSAELDRNNQMILNNRNLIVKYATEFMDAVNHQNLATEFSRIISSKMKKITIQELEELKERLIFIIVDSNTAITKYKIFEDENNSPFFIQLENYLIEYHNDITKLNNFLDETIDNISNIDKNPPDREVAKSLWKGIEAKKIKEELGKYTEKYNGKYKALFDLVRMTIPEIKVNGHAQKDTINGRAN